MWATYAPSAHTDVPAALCALRRIRPANAATHVRGVIYLLFFLNSRPLLLPVLSSVHAGAQLRTQFP